MLDRDIREYLHKHHLCKFTKEDASARIVDEMGLSAHAARIDIGVINGKLVGYEIKSDRDNLDRLPRQLDVYNQIFDLITVVCGPRHEDKLLNWLPEHCGLLVAPKAGVDVIEIRPASQNTLRSGYMIASLLWHEEAKRLLNELGCGKGLSRARRWELWEALAAYFGADLDALSDQVRPILKSRTSWREA